MLKGKTSRHVGNSSVDGLYQFLVELRTEGGVFSKVWHLNGHSCFDILDDLKIVFIYSVLKWGSKIMCTGDYNYFHSFSLLFRK
jgi:hypothetical protein